VLRLKVLNLLLALLPVHSVFLGESERLNKHCAPKSQHFSFEIAAVGSFADAQNVGKPRPE
jgi:hypothetical protein